MLLAAGLAGFAHAGLAQRPEPALSEAEVEILRDKAPVPPDRVLAFMGFLDDRTKAIDKLTSLKRRPGRDEDIHDMMEQFSSIANDLEDNLEEYEQRHRDLRKVLPKLIAATDRWGTALKTPPENEAYKISRTLALEALADIRASAVEMNEAEKAYFLAHPPAKDKDGDRPTETPHRQPF